MTNVQFGCGGNILEGFINHDSDVDITKPLPYATGTVDFVLAEHVCEHVTTHQFLAFLDECYRILKPNGRIRLCMPVLDQLTNPAIRDIILNHGHLAAYSPTTIKKFVTAAGFHEIVETKRKPMDGHWKVIGKAKDDQETARIEATR